jgi:hypothetical protein
MSPSKRTGQGESGSGGFSLLASDRMDVDVEPREKEEDVGHRLAAAFPDIRTDQIDPMDVVPPIHTPTKTPKKNVLNAMSTASKAPATPSFKGMKTLFAEPPITRTPVFEGLGEMLKTPDGYRNVRDEDVEMEEIAPVKNASRTKATSSRAPTSTRQKKTRSKVAIESIVEEETPGSQCDDVAKGGRRGRSRSKQPESDIENCGDDADIVKSKARNLRGSSKKAVQSITEVCNFFLTWPLWSEG